MEVKKTPCSIDRSVSKLKRFGSVSDSLSADPVPLALPNFRILSIQAGHNWLQTNINGHNYKVYLLTFVSTGNEILMRCKGSFHLPVPGRGPPDGAQARNEM